MIWTTDGLGGIGLDWIWMEMGDWRVGDAMHLLYTNVALLESFLFSRFGVTRCEPANFFFCLRKKKYLMSIMLVLSPNKNNNT